MTHENKKSRQQGARNRVGFVLTIALMAAGGGWYLWVGGQMAYKVIAQELRTGGRLLAEDKASPPGRPGPVAEIPALGKCLTEKVSEFNLETLRLAGVTALQSRAINVRYQACGALKRATNPYSCGWESDSELVAYRGQSELLVVKHHAAQMPFGARLDLAENQIKATLPATSVDPSARMQDICTLYSEQVIGEVANQLQWLPAASTAPRAR
ncbi:hypothetical protein VDS42_19015 [Xanthomonas campestris pv. campestris]|nr:hypothetical protein [Xanthomonas campestris pv. campestris]